MPIARKGVARQTVEVATDPAARDLLDGRAGLPDGHGREVREVRVGIARAEHDRQFVRGPQRLESGHRAVERERVAERNDFGGVERHVGTIRQVRRVEIRHDGVESVVAAVERDDHEDRRADGQRRDARRLGDVVHRQRRRHRRGAGRPGVLEELTPVEVTRAHAFTKYSGAFNARSAKSGGVRDGLIERSLGAHAPLRHAQPVGGRLDHLGLGHRGQRFDVTGLHEVVGEVDAVLRRGRGEPRLVVGPAADARRVERELAHRTEVPAPRPRTGASTA
jgi:hypothetical protein